MNLQEIMLSEKANPIHYCMTYWIYIKFLKIKILEIGKKSVLTRC